MGNTYELIFWQICRLEPATLLKIIFLQVILKDFAKLWVDSHRLVLYTRLINYLLQLFKPLPLFEIWNFFRVLSQTQHNVNNFVHVSIYVLLQGSN